MSVEVDSIESGQIETYSPLQSLFAQHKQDCQKIKAVIDSMDSKVLEYFFDAAMVNNARSSINVSDVFVFEPAIKAVDAKYWQSAMMMTNVLEYMAADQRNEWHEQIRNHKTPEFNRDNVTATLKEMLASREMFMAQRVDGIFRNLSHEHVTNVPQGFGKRFIMYIGDFYSASYDRINYIHDLRCVIAKIMNRSNSASSHNTYQDVRSVERDGQWHYFDGGAFKMRRYKKGTAHFEVHPEIAWQLNKILAYLHPQAIPAEFRTKPKKKPKEYKLNHDLIDFSVLRDLDRLRVYDRSVTWFESSDISPQVERILEYIGGVKNDRAYKEYVFDYAPGDVIAEIKRTGAIPEQKSHQYYPTPEHVARDAVDMADADCDHAFLEPSAGQGGIAKFLPKANTICVEISKLHCEILKSKGFEVYEEDFMRFKLNGVKFDRVVMNPPFSDGRAKAHVEHAYSLLSSDGALVAILPASFKGKEIIDGASHEFSDVYHNEFAGCSVNVVIVRITKCK